MGLIDDYFGTSDKRTTVDTKSTPYDGDTIDGTRIYGVDAPEAPTYREGHGYTEGVYHQEYTDMLEDGIDRGYDHLRFREKDAYNRPVSSLETVYGSDYAEEYTREGLLGPSRYALDDINIATAHANSLMNQAVYGTRQLPAWKQAEMLTKQAMSTSPGLTTDQLEGSIYGYSAGDRDGGSGAFDVGESVEYWWMTNKTAFDGLYALFDEEEGKRRIKARQKEFGKRIDDELVVSLEDVDSVGDAFAWLGNALIIQGPDYAIMAGGATAGAAIGTAILPGPGTAVGGVIGGFVGIGYNYLKSVGNYVAEDVEVNDEVNAGAALTIGAGITLLDRLGVGRAVNPGSVFSKEGKEMVAEQLIKKGEVENLTDAYKLIDQEAFRIIKDMRKDFIFQEEAFKSAKQLTLGTIRELGLKGLEEGATETGQELLQYISIHGTPQNAEEWKKMGWRLADAAAAGGAVGTVYQLPRSLKDRAGIQDVVNDATTEWTPENSSKAAKLMFDVNKVFGERTVESIIGDDYKPNDPKGDSFDELAEKFDGNTITSAVNKIQRGTVKFSSVKAMGADILYDRDGNIVPEVALIRNIEGADQTISGGSLYNTEKSNLNQLELEVPWIVDPKSHFKDLDLLDVVIRKMKNAPRDSKGRPMTDDTWTDQEKEYAAIVAGGIQIAMNKNTQIAGIKDEKTGKLQFEIDPRDHMNYYFQSSLPEIRLLKPNEQAATEALAKHVIPKNMRYKDKRPGQELGLAEASRLISNVLENKNIRETARDLYDLQVEEVLKAYYPTSEFERMATKMSSEIVSSTRDFYRGPNNSKYANMINSLRKRGDIDEKLIDEFAHDISVQISKHAGTFGRMKSDKARAVQDYARTFTTLGVLDKSAPAQVGELVWGQLGQDKPFLESLQSIAHGWFEANKSYYTKKKSEALKDYKYYGFDDDAAAQHGLATDQVVNKALNSWLFRLSQNSPLMMATRMDRMAGFARVVSNMGRDLAGVDLSDLSKLSPSQIETYESIIRMGGQPTKIVKAYSQMDYMINHADYSKIPAHIQRKILEGKALDPEVIEAFNEIDDLAMDAKLQEEIFEVWDHMVPKMVDEMVVRIKPGSRPGWFDDQRWGLPFFTQYLSYTAHWHANQLPRIYDKHMRGGSKKMVYSVFATAATAIVAAYYAQFLKDWITYGEESPHLATGGNLHRALLYSGLLGWAGEVEGRFVRGPYGFGAAAQALSSSDKSLVGQTLESLFESPTASHIEKVGEKIYKGKYQDAAERAIPFADIRPFRSEEGKAQSALDLFFNGDN